MECTNSLPRSPLLPAVSSTQPNTVVCEGRNLLIEHRLGAPKVKNVVASLVKVAGDDTYTALLFP
ncbi:hypothetical protein Bca52824_078795 [Brassica carinata]|uniref:Uncharacterized protein n=1 Tax=Brassica carinata TaxID=52824 RepID=A0A8X7U030_BRACI|nr:hypothetical protein Bca52824_078795 [Brassica carinata]